MTRGEGERSSDEETLLALDSDRLGMLWYMGEDAFSQGALCLFARVAGRHGARAPNPPIYLVTPCSAKPVSPAYQ